MNLRNCVCAALTAWGLVASAAPFKDGDTVVFYGDSITHGGLYHTYLQDYYLTRYPNAKIAFYNAGIAGDNARDAQPRFARDVAAHRPTAVSVMFGMNDVGRDRFASQQTDRVIESRRECIANYRKNMYAIDDLIKRAGIPEVYRLTPTPYEDTALLENAKERFIGCNAGLRTLAGIVREIAAARGGTVVDLNTSLNEYNRAKQAADPTYTIVGHDRVHPQAEGHLLMAYTFLRAQNADALVSSVGLDYTRKEVEVQLKAKVSDVRWDRDEISFTVLEEALPMPIDAKARALLKDIPVVRDLNQEILAMRTLPKGRWALEIDGERVGSWLPMDWERGINLAMNAKTPMYRQAQRVHEAVFARKALENRLVGWKACKYWLDSSKVDSDNWDAVETFWKAKPNRTGYFEQFYPDFRANWDNRAEQERKIDAAADAARAVAKPVPHRYRIVRSEDAPSDRTLSAAERRGATPVDFPFESTVIVQGTQSTSAFAVKEFNALVRKATGRTFEVRTTGRLEGCADKKKIYIGRGPELDAFVVGWWIDQTYGEEESVVMLKDGDLCLFGKDALGSLWAVYDFCEDSLGYRWFLNVREDDGGETINKTDIVRFNGIQTRRQPKFRGRRMMWGAVQKQVASHLFRVRNRDNQEVHAVCPEYKHPLQLWTKGHGFNMYLPSGEITPGIAWGIPKGAKIEPNQFKKHPEYFSLMADGQRSGDHQLCLSNPGCRKALIDAISEYVRVSGKGAYMVGENDARFGRYCYCDGCRALEKKYNTTGGPMWDFVIEACNEIRKRFGEGVYLQTLAYDGLDQTEKAPCNLEKFPENFIVDIAYIHVCDRSIRQLADRRAPEGEMVNYWENTLKWTSLTSHASYWFYGTASPCMTVTRMTDEMRELYEAGVESPGACGTGGGYEFMDLTGYLYYKLLQDPYCDIRSHLEEAVRFKYGKAAPFVLKYMDALEQAFIAYRATCSACILNTDRCYFGLGFITGRQIADWRALFDEAEKALDDSTVQPSTSNLQPSYRANLREAKIGLDILTALYEKRVREAAPECRFDRAAVIAEGRAAAAEYAKRHLRPGGHNWALEILDQAEKEMAYYGNLKSDALPKEFDGLQPQFITRILPYKSAPLRPDMPDKFTSLPDGQAVSGYAVVDRISDKANLEKGIPCYIWDWGGAKQYALKTIPLSALKKDAYTLVHLGQAPLSPECSIIFAELWGSPLAQRFLSRAFDPASPKKKFDIWVGVRAEGPKFFPGDTRPNKLYLEQLFAIEVVGSGN